MRRMIPQKLIDSIKHLSIVEPQLLSLAEKSTELLAIEDIMSIADDVLTIDKDSVVDGDLRITGDGKIDGKLEIGEPNVSRNFTPREDLPEGLEWGETSYLKFEVYGNILFLVIEAEIKNTTAEAIVSGALSFLVSNLPDDLCEKIIRRDGTNLKQAYSSSATITNVLAKRGANSVTLVVNSYLPNSLGGYFDNGSIPANSSQWCSARLFLTL